MDEQKNQTVVPGSYRIGGAPDVSATDEDTPDYLSPYDEDGDFVYSGGGGIVSADTSDDADLSPAYKSEDELIKYLEQERDKNRRYSREDIERDRRRRRTEEIVSGISDAVRSLSNLYFTSKRAPNMYNPSSSLSEASKARWDKAIQEREAENDRFFEFASKINSIRSARELREYNQAKDAAKAQRQEHIDAFNQELKSLEYELKLQLAQGKLEDAAATRERMDRLADQKILYMQQSGNAALIRANKSGSKGRSGGSAGSAKYWLDTPEGRRYFPNAAMYNKEVDAQTEKLGVSTAYVKDDSAGRATRTSERAAGVEKIAKEKNSVANRKAAPGIPVHGNGSKGNGSKNKPNNKTNYGLKN